MWRCRLQNNYSSFEDFQWYDEIYNLARRLGFKTAAEAWLENPVVQGSVDPSDFRVVKDRRFK